MKTCSLCKTPKPPTEFNANRSRKDGLQTKCRSCSQSGSRAYYAGHRDRMREQITSRKKEVVQEGRYKVFEYLQAHPCVDCGEGDPVVLDFDHVRGVKKANVTKMVFHGCTWATIESEIQKCEVRCANCHRRKTAKERRFFRHHSGLVQRQDSGF